jgi:RNA polymerase sigma-70 factor (ECF subfamily)
MDSETTVQGLLARVVRRDAVALGDLYERFSPRVLGLLARILRVRSLAEEVLQDVFVRLWDEAGNLSPVGGSVAAWLMLMARQTALDRIRTDPALLGRTAARAGVLKESAAGKPSPSKSVRAQRAKSVAGKSTTSAFVAVVLPAWLPWPEQIARLDERLVLLRKVAGQLPKAQRQALNLAVFAGYTEAEMAEMLGEPLGKVRTALRAAVTFLRHRLHAVVGTWAANI